MGVTREAIMKNIPEITSEQLDAMLALYGTELQAEQKKTEEWKTKAGEVTTLKEQLAERTAAEAEARTELEKLKKESAQKKEEDENPLLKEVRELKEQLAAEKITNYAASNGLSGDHFSKVLSAFNGNVDLAKAAIDGIVALKGEWETGAALAKEQEIAKQSGNPGSNAGSTSTGDDFGKNIAVQAAKRAGTANEEILKHYRR